MNKVEKAYTSIRLMSINLKKWSFGLINWGKEEKATICIGIKYKDIRSRTVDDGVTKYKRSINNDAIENKSQIFAKKSLLKEIFQNIKYMIEAKAFIDSLINAPLELYSAWI